MEICVAVMLLGPGTEAVGVCKLWGIYCFLTSAARMDVEWRVEPTDVPRFSKKIV